MWQRWRRFSLFFLASLLFGCIFHAWALGQAEPSVVVERQFIVQQGIERYQVGKFT